MNSRENFRDCFCASEKNREQIMEQIPWWCPPWLIWKANSFPHEKRNSVVYFWDSGNDRDGDLFLGLWLLLTHTFRINDILHDTLGEDIGEEAESGILVQLLQCRVWTRPPLALDKYRTIWKQHLRKVLAHADGVVLILFGIYFATLFVRLLRATICLVTHLWDDWN